MSDMTDGKASVDGGPFGPSAEGAALTPAPRPVPPLLKAYLHILYSLPGVFLLGFGLLGFLGFGVNSDWKAASFLLPTATTRGTVTGQHRAYGSLGGSRNGSSGSIPIHALTYTFAGPDGTPCHGVSYTSADDAYQLDTSTAPDPDTPVGMAVSVEYVKGHPTLSRIRHLRTGVFGAYALGTIVFPLAGLFFLRGGLRLARRTCAMLAGGRQDPKTGNLYPPPGQEQPKERPEGYEVTSFMTGPPRIREGQLYAPALPRVLLVFGLLAVMLLVDIAVFGQAVRHLGY